MSKRKRGPRMVTGPGGVRRWTGTAAELDAIIAASEAGMAELAARLEAGEDIPEPELTDAEWDEITSPRRMWRSWWRMVRQGHQVPPMRMADAAVAALDARERARIRGEACEHGIDYVGDRECAPCARAYSECIRWLGRVFASVATPADVAAAGPWAHRTDVVGARVLSRKLAEHALANAILAVAVKRDHERAATIRESLDGVRATAYRLVTGGLDGRCGDASAGA